MQNSPFFTNFIKRCSVIANQFGKVEEMEPKEIKGTLEELNHLCDHDEVILFFLENNLHTRLLTIFVILDAKSQRIAVKILTKVIRHEVDIKARLQVDKDTLLLLTESFTKVIEKQPGSSTLEVCLGFLVEIYGKDFKYLVPVENQELLLQAVISSFNWDNSNIVYFSIYLLNMGLQCESLVTGFLKCNIKNIILKLCAVGSNHKMGMIICKFLYNSLDTSESNAIFYIAVKHNLGYTLLDIILHGSSTITSEYYLAVISLLNKLLFFNDTDQNDSSLCQNSNEYARRVLQSHQLTVINSLLEAFRTFNIPSIIIAGLNTFYLTLSLSENKLSLMNKSDQISWLSLIHEIVMANFDCLELVEWSLKVLHEMFLANPKMVSYVGLSTEVNKIPIDSVVIQVFYTQNSLNSKMFIASCNLVSVLAFHSEKIQNRFLESNLHMIIHWFTIRLTHKINSEDLELQIRIASTHAQRSLIIFNNSAKELFFNDEVQYKEAKYILENIFNKVHVNHNERFAEIIAENLLFLASLVEYCPFKYDFLLGKEFNLSKILICENCCLNSFIFEALQELLIVLSGSEFETDFLLNLFPLKEWLETSSKHLNCYAIQKNTMIFLQLNSPKIDEIQQSQILMKIAEFIYRSTKIFKDSIIIQVEAFVLIQIMITNYPEFIKCCIEFNLEIFLFESINAVFDEDIIKIGIQALSLILGSNDTREKIVEKAIKKRNTKLLEFILDFGTDISKTYMNTLLLAVKQKPDELCFILTSSLLNNGCRPDNSIIRTCLIAENYKTVGLLLSCHGISDTDKASNINWSDLGLEKLEIEWFKSLYKGIGEYQIDRKLKLLIKRIKLESMNIMKLKKWHQHNMSSSIIQSRYPFTQDRTLEHSIGGYVYKTKLGENIDRKLSSKDDEELSLSLTFTPEFVDLFSNSLGTISFLKDRYSFMRQRVINSRLPKLSSGSTIMQSVDDLYINSCLNSSKQENYKYIPLPEELEEFHSLFRSGSDYCYNASDPRCMINNKRKRSSNSSLKFNFSRKTSLNNFARLKSSIEESDPIDLNVKDSELTNLPDHLSDSLSNVSFISEMNLSRNNLVSINVFCEISKNSKLAQMCGAITILNLQCNNITTLPQEVFKTLISLEQLDLSTNYLTEFPWEVFIYCKLIHLNLSKNKIKQFKIPQELKEDLKLSGKVKLLKQLLLAENDFTNFFLNSLKLFTNLERLDMQMLHLNLTNEDVFPLPTLKRINLRSTTSNSMFGKNLLNHSKDLQSIDLSENELYPIEELFYIPLYKFENLTKINVSHNILACKKPFFIPKCLLKVPKLQQLNISYNNITEFPACSLWKSQEIRDLDFSHNSIHTLNLLNAKTNFQALETLNISYNKIKQVPPEIGQLSNLNLLNISHNPSLTTLPNEIGLLKNKRLNGLIIEGLNLDIMKNLNPNARLLEILKYYHNRLKNSVEYYGLKVMVLGSGGRGKTTLLRSLQGKRQQKSKPSITIGINVSKWNFQGKFNDRQVNFKFSCWDLAGQEDFYSSHECFISQRALYLVVFDLSKGISEMESLKPWLLNLKSQAPQAPIIIIGSHLDKVKEENRKSQCKLLQNTVFQLCVPPAYPKISHFIAVDARFPNKSIDYLKDKIIQVLERHKIFNEPIIGEKQPASYLKLEEILQETLKQLPLEYPILMEKDMKEISQRNNLDIDEDELKQALQFLHNCGVIVHFDDVIMRLNNLYFINPQWLCSMMARIITLKALNPHINNGMMKLQDFVQLFIKQYFTSPLTSKIDIETHAMQCLKILEKFDVVFQRSNNEIIIPSRLQINRPSVIQMDYEVSKIQRRFEFTFLPTGFWPRLVTRISVLSRTFDDLFSTTHRELYIWKQGLSMSWENSIYLLLEGKHEEMEIIDIFVTTSELGLKILVQIIDSIEVLIEEWYPGLLDCDLVGNKMMKSYAICRYCDNKFCVIDIMRKSELSEQIECLKCVDQNGLNRKIDIRVIAPDIVLGDLPSYLVINPSLLEVDKTQENHIGKGGNGTVYKGRYNGEGCAIKYLNDVSSTSEAPSYRLLRQEIDILRRLRHPSLISLIAVDRERMILELAPLGELCAILTNYKLGRRYLQRISFQIIDGINFLHQKNILYRDLKMQNVLVFSMELLAPINVKLSDYGISRVMTYFGFVNFQGTLGYQAPEVVQRYLSYDLKSDIFSYGIVLFNIATGGKHPSDNKTYWRPGSQVELISNFGCENWPRMQECIEVCIENTPDDRPLAKDIISFVTCPTFISIKSIWHLTKQTRIECMVTKVNDNGKVEVLLANGNQYKQEVRWIDILSGKSKGKSFINNSKRTRVLCTTLLGTIALLGTHCGQIWIYNYMEDTFEATNICFSDSILTISILTTSDDLRIIFVGLANGIIGYKVDFNSIQDLQNESFTLVKLCNAPVTNLCLSHNQIFATCGSCIFKLAYSSINEKLQEIKIVEISSRGVDSLIKCFFTVTEKINDAVITSFYFTIRHQCLIYNYDDQGNQMKLPIDCEQIIRQKVSIIDKFQNTKIMCMTAWAGNRYLAVGTGSGHLIIIDQRINYVSVLSLYQYPIYCLQHTKFNENYGWNSRRSSQKPISPKSNSILENSISVDESLIRNRSRNSWLIVIGNGYKSIHSNDNDGAVMLLMSDDISKIARQIDEHLTNRASMMKNS